jgi:uncharacterized membrane protein
MTENPPPPPGGYPPPPPPGGYPPPGGGYQPQPGGYPPAGGGYQPPPGGGYQPPPGGNYPPAGGSYPPAGGSYPPPQQDPGGFPPPPGPGGYGPPQGGFPPQQGYPPMGGGPGGFNVGDAFGWAWNKFTKNAVPLIVATLAFAVLVLVLQGLVNLVQMLVSPGDTAYTADSSGFAFSYAATSFASVVVAIIGWFLLLIVSAAVQSAFLGGIFDIANGQDVSVGSFFKPRNIGNVIVAGLLVGIITTIGVFLCVIPGVIASIMLMFTVVAVLDRNLAPVDAIKASFETSKNHFGTVILVWLSMVLVVAVGAVLCGVGLLVAVPLASLILVYTYRTLHGGYVAPVTP